MTKAVKPLSENVLDTKTLNEKLLLWIGFTCTVQDGDYKYWRNPKKKYCFNIDLPDLTNNLDDQLKWIWPKLRELGFMIRYQYSRLIDEHYNLISDWTYYCTISYTDIHHPLKHPLDMRDLEGINKDSPALACAIAVEKLINALEKEKDDAAKTT